VTNLQHFLMIFSARKSFYAWSVKWKYTRSSFKFKKMHIRKNPLLRIFGHIRTSVQGPGSHKRLTPDKCLKT
jgi:hypothetical protein